MQLPDSLGWVLIGFGVLMLSYVSAMLWGSNLTEATAQQELATRWRSTPQPIQLDDPVVAIAMQPAVPVKTLQSPVSVETVSLQAPEPGQPIAQLEIPAIDLAKTIVFGTDRLALQSGPGLYPSTAWPGRTGNSAIAGHRTTYGAPFQRIDELTAGDEIIVETQEGRFVYLVDDPGHLIVAPEDVEVLSDRGDNRLTLTSCHPLYSARQRIVVTATLVGPPADRPPEPVLVPEPVVSLAGLRAATHPDLIPPPVRIASDAQSPGSPWWDVTRWAIATLAIASVARLIEIRWRRWPTLAVAVPPLAMSLMTFFVYLDRALPAS